MEHKRVRKRLSTTTDIKILQHSNNKPTPKLTIFPIAKKAKIIRKKPVAFPTNQTHLLIS